MERSYQKGWEVFPLMGRGMLDSGGHQMSSTMYTETKACTYYGAVAWPAYLTSRLLTWMALSTTGPCP